MGVIESFLKHYEREFDFYNQLSLLAKDILEKEIFGMGIKAIVTYRVKRVESLGEKLYRRNRKKKYKSFADIEKDIVDLAGIRVALYFPSDRKVLNKAIEELFEVKVKKDFPADPQTPKFNKRFSGYWATHYRVHLKGNGEFEQVFTTKMLEIQVASVLMHAWSEVEHDLVYKPLSGLVSGDELAILDEINGLVLTGEIALERLQKAYAERTKRVKEITDRYQLSMLVLNNFRDLDLSRVALGDTSLLNDYLEAVSKMKTDEVLKAFEQVNLNFAETVTDQILMAIITKDYDKNLKKYLSTFTSDRQKVAAYEKFLKTWVVLESVIIQINKEDKQGSLRPSISKLSFLFNFQGFEEEEIEDLKSLRLLRNKLLHGYNSLSAMELAPSLSRLQEITLNKLKKVKDPKEKNKLHKKLQQL